jgi:predicted transposase YbfD/YdcC
VSALGGQTAAGPRDGPPPDLEQAETVEKGHGRLEVRRIATSREIAPDLGWPGVAQVCRVERRREIAGKSSREVVYAVTSLPRERAGPDSLLALVRQHWAIENRLHWRRDVILREDASRVRSGAAPQALAALRNTALRLVHARPGPLTAIRETFAENRLQALALAKKGFL